MPDPDPDVTVDFEAAARHQRFLFTFYILAIRFF